MGAAYGARFALWDMGNLCGGKPFLTGASFPEGGQQFRYAFPSSPPPSSPRRSPRTRAVYASRTVRAVRTARPTAALVSRRVQ